MNIPSRSLQMPWPFTKDWKYGSKHGFGQHASLSSVARPHLLQSLSVDLAAECRGLELLQRGCVVYVPKVSRWLVTGRLAWATLGAWCLSVS